MDDIPGYFQRDQFARLVGVELLEGAPGYARARLVVGPQHLNSIGIVHGGALFALADLVFAVASNAHGTVAVGINANIAYLRAASEGTLIAEAREVSLGARLATYTVQISDEGGQALALFQGTVYRKQEPLPR